MSIVELVVHPTCFSSYRLLKTLSEKGFLNRLRILVADKPSIGLEKKAWSVPWLLVNGEPAAADPLEPWEVEPCSRVGVSSLPQTRLNPS